MTALNEHAKLAFRALDRAYQYIQDNARHDDFGVPALLEQIHSAVTGLQISIDRLSVPTDPASAPKVAPEPLTEHVPERYSQMAVARTREVAEDELNAFFRAVKQARAKHRIADVHVIARMNIETADGGETPSYGSLHCGAVQESESMCAWALGMATGARKDFVESVAGSGAKRGAA